MPATAPQTAIAVVGIDIGKNSFHIVGLDNRGAIVLRQKWSRGQVEARFANMPPCPVGMEACVRCASSQSEAQSVWSRCWLMPTKYVRPYYPDEHGAVYHALHQRRRGHASMVTLGDARHGRSNAKLASYMAKRRPSTAGDRRGSGRDAL